MATKPINKGRRNGGSIFRGVFALGRGQAVGIMEFGNDNNALTSSLAPLIAFPLVGSATVAIGGQPGLAALGFLSRLCGVLALPVITQAYAKWTGNEPLWPRTATALNWSFWILIPMLVVGAVIGAVMVSAGLPELRAEETIIVLLGMYMLWLHWFIVRTGLRLSVLKAIGLVVLSNAAIGVLTFGPDLIGMFLRK